MEETTLIFSGTNTTSIIKTFLREVRFIWNDSVKLSNMFIVDLVTDHHLVHSCNSITKPKSEREHVWLRKIGDIDVECFTEDIKSTYFFRNYTKGDLNKFVRVNDSDSDSYSDLPYWSNTINRYRNVNPGSLTKFTLYVERLGQRNFAFTRTDWTSI